MSGSKRNHWEHVYESKSAVDVSWYQPHLARSLELIRAVGLDSDARIIDVGGGASTLVDDLLEDGYSNVTVVDLSDNALSVCRGRLGDLAASVTWIAGDITELELPREAYDLWHDRAVFHFLTAPEEREAYIARVCRSVKPGGHVILATFGPDGPEKCSGLPVVRYAPGELHATFGEPFRLESHVEEKHETPWGTIQEFVYCWCVKTTDCQRG